MGKILCTILVWVWFYTKCNGTELTGTLGDPEINMDVENVIRYYGYPCESHLVTTNDGYILTMHRIPYGLKNKEKLRRVVLLQHGLLDSSFTWVNNGPNKSLGFILADQGFDVWLGNSRGNLYSQKHKKYSVHTNKFWDFTWDEMAQYDLPSSINYALMIANLSKLAYVGHSQGTEIAFAQFSKGSKLNDKVSALVALAPVVYIGNAQTILKNLALFMKGIHYFSNIWSNGEFIANSDLFGKLSQAFCGNKIGSSICKNIALLLQGSNVDNLNATRMPVYLSHYPTGTSTKNMLHYAQSYFSGEFQYFDYGFYSNKIIYNQWTVRKYDLNVRGLPVAMFWGGHDLFSSSIDVKKAIDKLGKDVQLKIFISRYNHLDFVWGMDAAQVVYPAVIDFINKFRS